MTEHIPWVQGKLLMVVVSSFLGIAKRGDQTAKNKKSAITICFGYYNLMNLHVILTENSRTPVKRAKNPPKSNQNKLKYTNLVPYVKEFNNT